MDCSGVISGTLPKVHTRTDRNRPEPDRRSAHSLLVRSHRAVIRDCSITNSKLNHRSWAGCSTTPMGFFSTRAIAVASSSMTFSVREFTLRPKGRSARISCRGWRRAAAAGTLMRSTFWELFAESSEDSCGSGVGGWVLSTPRDSVLEAGVGVEGVEGNSGVVWLGSKLSVARGFSESVSSTSAGGVWAAICAASQSISAISSTPGAKVCCSVVRWGLARSRLLIKRRRDSVMTHPMAETAPPLKFLDLLRCQSGP